MEHLSVLSISLHCLFVFVRVVSPGGENCKKLMQATLKVIQSVFVCLPRPVFCACPVFLLSLAIHIIWLDDDNDDSDIF